MRIHLGGSSRQSLVAARSALDASVKGASAASASELSSHLFLAAEVIAGNSSLRRAITDPARDKAAKAALVKDLFSKSTGTLAVSLLSELSGLRWSATKDLVYATEQLAIEAEASAANIAGELDRVEDEFFETSRVVADNFERRKALVSVGSTVTLSNLAYLNASAGGASNVSSGGFALGALASSTAAVSVNATYVASAEL